MGLWDFFGSSKTASDAAMPYYDQAIGQTRREYRPYQEWGQAFGDPLSEQYSAMMSDPAAFLAQLMEGYTQSDAYKMKLDEATKAAGATAAAGGYRGTPQDIQTQGRIAAMLQDEDMQKWLDNVFGIQGKGIQGAQHFYDTGYDATRNKTSDVSNLLQSQASLAYNKQREKQQRDQDILKALIEGGTAVYTAKYGKTF